MNDKVLLNIKDLEGMLGLKKSWIYARLAKGEMPRPINLGTTKRWHRDTINEWLDELKVSQ